jgi:hypothetical protein
MPDFGGFRFVDSLNPSEEPDATDPDPSVRRRYLGKYRGTVLTNVDPMQQGRLQVQVAGVAGLYPTTWAMPCLPMANIATGVFVRPAIGAGVWVEFEQGDPNRPIWVGGYWNVPQTLPLVARIAVAAPPATGVITVETATGGLSISDTPLAAFGNVCLRSGPSQIILTPDGIRIVAPTVSITTPAFSVNGVALTVTGA